jgi:hypothetical protein
MMAYERIVSVGRVTRVDVIRSECSIHGKGRHRLRERMRILKRNSKKLVVRMLAIRRPDMRVKHCAYGHSVATLLNPLGVTTVSHEYSLMVARHATVVVAVPFTVHYPADYKIKIYYLR